MFVSLFFFFFSSSSFHFPDDWNCRVSGRFHFVYGVWTRGSKLSSVGDEVLPPIAPTGSREEPVPEVHRVAILVYGSQHLPLLHNP